MDQIEEGQTSVPVALGNRDDQTKVGFNELVLGSLTLADLSTIPSDFGGFEEVGWRTIAAFDEPVSGQSSGGLVARFNCLGNFDFELSVEQWNSANFL